MTESIIESDGECSFVKALSKRIESLLPNHTGRSVEEVELDQQFQVTRSLLLETNTRNPRIVTYIFISFASILKAINTESSNSKIKHRDEKSRNSTLLVCKLLADILKSNWDRESTILDDKDLLSNYSRFYYYDRPNRIDPTVVPELVDIFINMLSSGVVRKALSLVRNEQTITTIAVAKEEQDISREDLPLTKEEEIAATLSDIDWYLDTIIRYISTANPDEYYSVVQDKLYRYSAKDQTIPLPILQKYCPLMKYFFFSEENHVRVADDTLRALPCIRSTTWKQVYLYFFTNSIKDQSFSRTLDYNILVDVNDIHQTQVVKTLFDASLGIFFENTTSSSCGTFVLTWILALCLEDIKEVNTDKPLNKLKLTFNKRMKFMMTVLKDTASAANMESFDAMIHIFHLGTRLQAYNLVNHPIHIFSLKFLDETYRNLLKYGETHKDDLIINDELSFQYEFLTVNFYIAALMLRPEKYSKIIISNFNQNLDELRANRVLVKIIKGLSEIETAQKVFLNLMHQLTPTLKKMIYGALKILNQFEAKYSRNVLTPVMTNNDSSQASIFSDIASMEQENKANAATQVTLNTIKTSLDHYADDLFDTQSRDSNSRLGGLKNIATTTDSSHLSASTYRFRIINGAEELLSDIFQIFTTVPDLYFNSMPLMSEENYKTKLLNELLPAIMRFCHEAIIPLRLALKSRWVVQGNTKLVDSSKALCMKMVAPGNRLVQYRTDLSVFANFNVCNCIIFITCEACLSISLLSPKFKSCFLFLNEFLQKRSHFDDYIAKNPIISNPETQRYYEPCGDVIHSVEKVLLLSLCTHDVSFYNYAVQGLKWYVTELEEHKQFYRHEEVTDTLLDTFRLFAKDDSVFTGFASLHKRHRNILREAKSTKSLYQVWLMIYYRWLKIVNKKEPLGAEENLVFRHYTGFIVSTSGCFISSNPFPENSELRAKSLQHISELFDKCIELLTSQDMVIQMVVKEALSNESHSELYRLIAEKLMNTAAAYFDKYKADDIVLFLDRALMVMTAMINVKSEGALFLAAMLPEICQLFIKCISSVENQFERLKVQLRFCKLGIALEADRTNCGLNGAFKLRNVFAKSSMEWLEQAVFFDEVMQDDVSSATSKEVDTTYLALDLAVESSHLLRGQVENLLLEVPDGIKDDELKKYKDLSFSNYFSLFYKIIQKYTKLTPNNRERHKHHVIIDNVLQSITNILQFDSQIGMRFILPMGYHENKKIRAIFLNVFSKMLLSQSLSEKQEEYPDDLIEDLTDLVDIFGAIAECASSFEHNLLASSLFGVFSYAGKLNKLFKVLLSVEVAHLSRSSDLFRRNSTLTKFLSFYAQAYGIDYLDKVIQPIIEDLVVNDVQFEVEKVDTSETTDLFMTYLDRIVNLIVNSTDELPNAFKWLCAEVYNIVAVKFPEAAYDAVSSFIFLRFICPAIISPEQQFKIQIHNPKVKRSLMQLVKLLQNMANGTMSSIKWPALSNRCDKLKEDNAKIADFLREISTNTSSMYEFQKDEVREKPLNELRYLHKFIYTYFTKLRLLYLFKDAAKGSQLHDKAVVFKKFDLVVMKLGQPKPSVRLQLHSTVKLPDSNNLEDDEIKFNDFMTKMSLKYADTPPDAIDVIHSSIFKDGTPAVVVNLKKMNSRPQDVSYLVYKLMETASQVWDNKFYLVYDFTEYYHYTRIATDEYANLLANCSTKQMFSNCLRVYYFNIPRTEHPGVIDAVKAVRAKGAPYSIKIYTYSLADPDHVIRNLCLDQETVAINRENKVSYDNVLLFEPTGEKFLPVKLKIGRRFVILCFKNRVRFHEKNCETDGFVPVEVYRITEFVKCEVSNFTGHNDEFTMFLNHGVQVTLRFQNRLEILRFLYFTISRLPKEPIYLASETDYQNERHSMHWFGRLYNIVFQGLLNNDEDVKSKAATLFGSLSTYFEIDFGIRESHAVKVPFPADATNFVVSVSAYLADNFPQMTYRFFKAFFDNFERMDKETRFTSILYLSPWIQNIYEYVYLSDENGADKTADLFRLLCRLTNLYKDQIPFINDYIWSKLFQEARLVLTLVEEVVAFAIDSKNDSPDWSFIIAVIRPSIEVCGEVTSRLTKRISVTLTTDSTVALESKLFEISVLIKICSSLFFNSYNLAKTYLAELIFFVTLFIDDCHLDVGEDLQKLLMTAIQSLLHKPGITEIQQKKIDEAIAYFSTPRAKMIFGTNRDTNNINDIGQTFNRISNFERFTDYLNDFLEIFGSTEDRTNWRARWSSKAIDVAFNNYSLFQDRAVLVVGILAKQGISDSTACRTIKLISNGALHSIKLAICVAVAVARILDGLPDNSVLPPILIWPQLSFALLNHSVLYQASLLNVIASITKIMRSVPNYIDRIFEERQFLEPTLSEMEKRSEYSITKHNFGMHMFFILTQGLRVSQYRHLSITCIKTYFKARFQRDKVLDTSTMETNAYAYLMLLYLCCDSKEVKEFFDEIGLVCEFVDLGDGQKIPGTLVDFLIKGDNIAQIVMIHAGYFFKDVQGVDISFKARFIRIYLYLLRHNRELALMIYHLIQPTMIQDLVSTVSLVVVRNISNTIELVGRYSDYNPQVYIKKIDDIIAENNIEILKKLRDLKPLQESIDENFRFKPEFDHDIKSIQSMLYRAACNYVVGSKLED
ncbi:Inhibitory regulator protein IRA1 [Candida viswanathii]|uniref:Inhibitory regulator protein IRA1 n=1 Tax=Candida viswanathii TaxID=5486 RepID=A0A367YEM3_9ASCO|nr:Inhibitory regulator protein IRA1 [Candida viswanathii]